MKGSMFILMFGIMFGVATTVTLISGGYKAGLDRRVTQQQPNFTQTKSFDDVLKHLNKPPKIRKGN